MYFAVYLTKVAVMESPKLHSDLVSNFEIVPLVRIVKVLTLDLSEFPLQVYVSVLLVFGSKKLHLKQVDYEFTYSTTKKKRTKGYR